MIETNIIYEKKKFGKFKAIISLIRKRESSGNSGPLSPRDAARDAPLGRINWLQGGIDEEVRKLQEILFSPSF